jgi:hypothetical protein
MPAKTPLKLKKKIASKPAARAAPKSKNGVSKKHNGAMGEMEKLRQDATAAQEKVALLEVQIANDGDQLRAAQARLTTREAEVEAARSEARNLREAMNRSKATLEPGKLRCPRCEGSMTEFTLESVRADRCGSCYGIFLDNGELETVLKHHDQQRDAGSKHWYSGLFGRK